MFRTEQNIISTFSQCIGSHDGHPTDDHQGVSIWPSSPPSTSMDKIANHCLPAAQGSSDHVFTAVVCACVDLHLAVTYAGVSGRELIISFLL